MLFTDKSLALTRDPNGPLAAQFAKRQFVAENGQFYPGVRITTAAVECYGDAADLCRLQGPSGCRQTSSRALQ